MNTTLKFGIAGAVVTASVLAPLLVHHNSQPMLREKQAAIQEQTDRLAQLGAENGRLSNLAAQANESQSLAKDRFAELLKLRNVTDRLREETNEIQQLRDANRRLKAGLDEELSAETIGAIKGICRKLPGALQRFANDHTNQAPADFAELRKYFPAAEGAVIGLHSFEFVREVERTESGMALTLTPRDGVVLTEKYWSPSSDRENTKLYGFMDGRIIEGVANPLNGSFSEWEKQNLNLSPAAGQ